MTRSDRASQADLHDRYPLPEWVIDSKFKQRLTLAIADTIAAEVERRPGLEAPASQQDYAEHVTRAAHDALKPLLTWLEDHTTDGFSYPGDPLVSYIAQLALTRPDETPDIDRYRDLLRSYSRYLAQQAQRFDEPGVHRP